MSWAAPNFPRPGTITGFVLIPQTEVVSETTTTYEYDEYGEPVEVETTYERVTGSLVPALTRGVLFAQGTMYRPAAAPVVPAAPPDQQSWLWYGPGGLYWRATNTPAESGDALIGWVRANAMEIVAVSSQWIGAGEPQAMPRPAGTMPEASAPGDVQAIGEAAFTLTKEEDGINATLSGAYNPPSPIGTFIGVKAHVESPEGSKVISQSHTFDYDGDPGGVGAARYGNFKLIVPQQTDAGRDVRVYLTARSAGYDKPLVLHGAAGESPSVVMAISQAMPPLAAPDPVNATACSISVLESGDTFGLRTSWTPASPYGGTVAYEREARYYSDANGAAPISAWIPLGSRYGGSEDTADAGYWPKPTVATYVRFRIRAVNADGDTTAWLESSTPLPQVPTSQGQQIPPPAAPTNPVVTVLEAPDSPLNFGLRTAWTAPADLGSTVEYDREVRYYSDANGAAAESDWIPLGAVAIDVVTADSGWWPRPEEPKYVRFRVRGSNGVAAKSEWAESTTPLPQVAPLATPGAPTNPTVTVLDGGETYGLRTAWTAPAEMGSTAEYDREVRHYSDVNGITPVSGWIPLGPVGIDVVTADSGWWPRPEATEYVRFRVRGSNGLAGKSAWVETGAPLPAVAPLAAPGAPTNPSLTVLDGGETYGFRTTWAAPVPLGSAVGYDREVRYYSDANGATPVSDWIALGRVGTDVTTADSGWWPRPEATEYVRFRLRSFNSREGKSAWVETGAPLPAVVVFAAPPIPAANASTIDSATIGGIPSFRFHLAVASGGGTTVGFEAQARYYSDAGAATPISDWIPLGQIDIAGTADTDYWPRPDTETYAKVRVAAVNARGVQGPWKESAVLTRPASTGLVPPAPPAAGAIPPGATITVEDGPAQQNGVPTYQFRAVWGAIADANTVAIEAECVWTGDANPRVLGRETKDRTGATYGPWPRPSVVSSATITLYPINTEGKRNAAGAASALVSVGPSGTNTLKLNTADPNTVGPGLTHTETGLKLASENLGNLLPNPGFEDGGAHWNVIQGAEVVSGGMAPGTRCVKGAVDTATVDLARPIPCLPGDRFRAEFWVKVDPNTDGYNICYLVFDWSGQDLGYFTVPPIFGVQGQPAGEWRKYTVTGTCPATASSVHLAPMSVGGITQGAYYVDNVRLTKITTADEMLLGGGLTSRGEAVSLATDNLANLIMNPGFEDGLAHWTADTPWSVSDALAYTGGKSLTGYGNDKNARGTTISARPGDRFYAEAWVTCADGTDGAFVLALDFLDADGVEVSTAYDAASTFWGQNGAQWTKVQFSAAAPSGASFVRVRLHCGYGGTAGAYFVDSVYLQKVKTASEIMIGKGLLPVDGAVALDENGDIQTDPETGAPVLKLSVVKSENLFQGTLGADLSKWAADKKPVGIYFGLPAYGDQTAPDVIYNTQDGLVYRRFGGVWEKGTRPQDIVAGSVASTVTITGTVYANKLVENGGGITGCRLTLNLNGVTVSIDNQWDAVYGAFAGVAVKNNSSQARAIVSYAGIGVVNANGHRSAELSDSYLCIRDGSGNITADVIGASGSAAFKSVAAKDANNMIVAGLYGADGSVFGYSIGASFYGWNGNGTSGAPLRLGPYRLWVDGSGRLRIKFNDPGFDTDGAVVGAQS